MSGFAGIVNLDGAPVKTDLVQRMLYRAERHGNSHPVMHAEPEFAFGHVSLAASPGRSADQPFTRDGNAWIVGDVRSDARDQLIAALRACDLGAGASQADIELALLAFMAWGLDCVERLLGDFAFVVWQRRERRLFCARDTFGVKPLYYARFGDEFAFANDIDALRSHPRVSTDLHEAAVCDYFVQGYNIDQGRTFFRDIRRLPPSSALATVAGRADRPNRFTRIRLGARARCASSNEYAERFLESFRDSVADRLRSDRIAVELSGGLDSASVAAMAAGLSTALPDSHKLAVTTGRVGVTGDDPEIALARDIATLLGFGHETVDADNPGDFFAYAATAQPFPSPFIALSQRFAGLIRAHGRLMLTGQGGDPLMHGSGLPLLDAFRDQTVIAFIYRLLGQAVRRRSLQGLGLRSLMARGTPRLPPPRPPDWLRPEFLERSGTLERWHALFGAPDRFPAACRSELAWDELQLPVWTHLFEDYYHDLFSGIDCRHPFFDLRVVEFLLSTPASVRRDKQLLRIAFADRLPPTVLSRPKAVVRRDRVQEHLGGTSLARLMRLPLEPLAAWIDIPTYHQSLQAYADGGEGNRYTTVYPLNLRLWMTEKLC